MKAALQPPDDQLAVQKSKDLLSSAGRTQVLFMKLKEVPEHTHTPDQVQPLELQLVWTEG